MITDPESTTLLSSMGWVDGDALRRFDVASAAVEIIPPRQRRLIPPRSMRRARIDSPSRITSTVRGSS